MNLFRLLSVAALASVACASYAGGTVTVSGSGGSVTAADSSGNYAGLQGTASTATIQYGSNSGNNQLKFSTGPSGTTGAALSGSSTNGATTTNTTGQSNVSNAPGAPTYYTANWSSTATNPGSGPVAGSGTYDPWTVTQGNLHDAGVYDNAGMESLYYQASLDGGAFNNIPQGTEGAYNFSVGEAGHTFLDLTIFNDQAPKFTFDTAPSFDVYLLNPRVVYGAYDTIQDRLNNGMLLGTKAVGTSAIQSFLNTYLQHTSSSTAGPSYSGSLGGYSLTLAIVYHIALPTYDPANHDKPVVQWNTDTMNSNPVPEPAPLAALGLGALGLLRRRRK